MKIADIVIKDKCIVLGVFDTPTFAIISNIKGVNKYIEFDHIITPDYKNVSHKGIILDTVLKASIWAKQIIFILDKVQFPIDPSRSVTCGELQLVCENPHLFDKCIFVKGDNVIEFDKNLVLNS